MGSGSYEQSWRAIPTQRPGPRDMYPVLSGNLHAGEAKTTPGPISSTHGDTYGAIMVRDSLWLSRASWNRGIEHITHSRLRQHQGCTLYLHGQLSSGHWFSLKGIRNTAGPYIAHLESQYSWAHMDPSAHSLAFRGGAEVPEGYRTIYPLHPHPLAQR